jgi:hypothetical protein
MQILLGKLERESSLRRLRHRRENIIKLGLEYWL